MSETDVATVGTVVDTDRYPIADDGSVGARWWRLVDRVRRDLDIWGCSVLPDFIRLQLRDELRAECAEIAPLAHHGTETVNAYNIPLDTPLPNHHPARITVHRGNAFVARDRIPESFLVHRLYTSSALRRLVADCFSLTVVHPLADPLSGLCLNVVTAGQRHPWHFDTNEFTISMLTQQPKAGGVFEYCPNIRSAGAENVEAVREVLVGRGERRVRRLVLRPGDLQLFRGRFSLHRVTTVSGTVERHSAIFAYSERPGVVGSVERTRQLFGRTLPEHETAARRAVRADGLLD